MNFDSIVSWLFDNLPDNITLDFPLPDLGDYIPTQVDIISMLKFLALLAAGALVLGILGRIITGKRSDLNHALSCAIGILVIYAVTIVIYTLRPWELHKLLSPLPFVAFVGDHLSLFPLQCGNISAICYEVVSLLILAFLINLLDTFISQGDSVPAWYLLRFLTVILAMVCHYLVRRAFNTYLPDVLVNYAPMILLGVLVAMLLLGALNVVLSMVLAAVEPILGAIYAFFFSNIVGKQLTKAMVTTVVLTALVFAVEHFGVFLISISLTALVAYIPFVIVLLILWYVIGHIL